MPHLLPKETQRHWTYLLASQQEPAPAQPDGLMRTRWVLKSRSVPPTFNEHCIQSQKPSPEIVSHLFCSLPQCEGGQFNYFQGHRLFPLYCQVPSPDTAFLVLGKRRQVGSTGTLFASDEKPLLSKLLFSYSHHPFPRPLPTIQCHLISGTGGKEL